MNNDAHTTNSSTSNQGQESDQNNQPITLAKRVANLKTRGRWIDRTVQRSTMIKLRQDLDLEIPNVQEKLESYSGMDHKSDPMLMLEQKEEKEKWSKYLSDLKTDRERLSKRASELLKSDSQETK